MLGRVQRPSRKRGLHITLPLTMSLVAHPTRQRGRQAEGITSQFKPLGTRYMPPASLIRRPDDMLSSPLRQHILDYELPRRFVIPTFATFDGSTDPYNHMLHYNQTMILNAGNDHLLCKEFLTSLRGHALAWFHKLLRNSINLFSELLAVFVS